MTWTENEFSSCIKSMRGSLSEINNFEKRSSSREDPSSSFNTNPEPKTYMQQLISRNNEPKLKHFGDLMKMQTGNHSTKNFLKRSQSSNEGSCAADFRPTYFRSKNLDVITSQHDFSSRFEELEIQDIDVKNSSRGSYRDDAISTNSDLSPLLPLHVPSCHEAHENVLFISCSPSSSSLISNKSINVLANLDSLSICDDDEDVPARISIMNDSERRKAKSNVKSLYNIKTCSETDNKELNAAIQIAQNASSCFSSNKKSGQSRIASGKRSRWKVHHKEDRKTFSEDSRLHEDYHSTPNEQLTYNELISKPAPSYGDVFVPDVQRDRVNSLGHIRCRQHSSLSDSENLLNLTRDHAKECLLTSRSDGTEVPLFEDKLELFVHKCPEIIPACRHKSYPSGMGSSHASKQLAISQSVATSSRSLPTSLESNSRTFPLERQISTPLPNTSIALLSELDKSKCPPLPEKKGSRSNLSISDLKNQKVPKTVKPLFYHSHPPSIKDNILSTTNQIQMEQLLSSTFSQEETANNFGAIQSEHLPSARNAVPTIDPASPPPLPSRTFFHFNTKSTKGPPLPPKGAVNQTILHRHPLPFQRPSSEESDNLEESSSSSESSNFASSIDSEGLGQYSETCICKQLAGVDVSKNVLPPPFIQSTPGHSILQEDDLLEKACAPMPGRYETSDSLVYDYFESPPLDTCYRECHHITEKVSVLKKHFPEVSTNDLECALIENNYSIEETIKHLTVKLALAPSSRYNSSNMTSCIISRHRQHFVPDPMEA